MKKIIVIIILALAAVLPLPGLAVELNDIDWQSIVRVDILPDSQHPVEDYFWEWEEVDEEDQTIQYGTGFFVDYSGCLITNSHVIRDWDGSQFKNYMIRSTSKAGDLPEKLYKASLLFSDPGVDIAVLCLDDPEKDFYHFFEFADDAAVNDLDFGDSVYNIGYPDVGGETITYTIGKIAGFWSQPDLLDFLGEDFFESDRLEVIKTDTVTGPGGSGSPVFNEDKEVIGVIFAAAFVPSGINFVISGTIVNDWYELYLDSISPSTSCLRDVEQNLFKKEGKYYYDPFCSSPQNINTENIVQINYQERCKETLEDKLVKQAAHHIMNGSSIEKWWDYLKKICPSTINIEENINESSDESQNLESSIVFAYNKLRLSDLEIEKERSVRLKKKLNKILGEFSISNENWYKIVNAYIYGGYPVDAIAQSIKIGGYTVHTSIPFESWKNSDDYLENM